jgi:hypothetical protein
MGVRKSSEEAIQQVLAGLRDCEAAAGMERRILEAVRDRASARSAASWGGLRPLSHWCAMWPLGGGLVLVVISVSLSFFLIHRTGHSPTRSPVQSARAESVSPAASGKVAEENGTKTIARTRGNAATRKRVRTNASDLAILRDMRAPSHPAPEAPLTEEEKILLRIAHTGNAEEFALLNPEMQARQDAQIEADFQRFVAQSNNEDQE